MFQGWILLGWDWDLGPGEVVHRGGLILSQIDSLSLVELVSIIISRVEAEFSGIDLDISLQREVLWHHWAAIWLEIYQALEEGTLRNTRVYLLGLGDHDRLVLQVVEDGDKSHSGILEAALNDVLFEVTVESQDLLVELDVGGLELRLDVAGACVVGVLDVRDRHALGSFRGCKVALGRSGHSVQRHRLVLRVSDLLQMNVGDLLVLNDCRVVRRRVAWQLGEVL